MIKRVIAVIIVFAVIAGALGYVKAEQIQEAKAMGAASAPPPPAVSTTVAGEDVWPRTLFAVGTVESVQGVQVAAQLDGPVTEIAFKSGTTVKQGDVLARQDTSTDVATLRSAQARAQLALLQLRRNEDLRASNSISQADLDAAKAESASAQADVEALQATINKKTIRAPFSGKLGIRAVNLGDYLRAGDPIVPLESLDPIFVNFSLPQQELAEVAVGQTVRVQVDTFPGEEFEGKLSAINSRVDTQTRALQIQAELPNPDGRLLPGMFVRAHVELPNPDHYVTLPITAVTYTTFGDSVYLVEQGENGPQVRQVNVRTAGKRGNQVAIASGVPAGAEVVTSGQMKLRNNSPVRINNEIAVPSEANPSVVER